MEINVNQTVGSIVASFPKAAEIFKKYKIDFCCGGDRKLGQIILEQNLDESQVLEDLNYVIKTTSADETQKDWITAPLDQLVDHIINKYHRFLHNELTPLSDLITKILKVHGANHKELARVHRLYATLKIDLEQHLIKEEEMLFPIIKEYVQNPSDDLRAKILSIIGEIETEHALAGDVLKELRKITADYSIPVDACTSYRLAYRQLETIESDLFQHIHLENNILHKRLG